MELLIKYALISFFVLEMTLEHMNFVSWKIGRLKVSANGFIGSYLTVSSFIAKDVAVELFISSYLIFTYLKLTVFRCVIIDKVSKLITWKHTPIRKGICLSPQIERDGQLALCN